ncbi:MAG: TolC family protein [Pseudomonadota bacterium]
MRQQLGIGFICLAALTGCMQATGDAVTPSPEVTRAAGQPPQSFAEAGASEIIGTLQSRSSVIPSGSSYARIAQAVLAANARPAEADLRAARLRSQAASKNWLPQLGPSITLTSLSSVAAGILVQQVVFDNGRRKAERAFAAADVEAVAVTLSTDTNARVLTGLTLFLKAEQAREAAHVSARAADRMRYFQGIMGERVDGGVSDISDLRVVATKLKEAENRAVSDREDASVALAELAAMSDRSLSDVRGLVSLATPPQGVKPLGVLSAEAIRTRDIAQANMERADMLPGASISGSLGEGQRTQLSIDTAQLIGAGTGASLAAVQAAKDAADRRVAQSKEDANRLLRRLSQQLTALDRQEGEARALAKSAWANQDVFQEQFEAGARPILDVIGNYETAMRLERDAVRIKYDRARVRLEIANVFGALVDGEDI